MGKSLSKFFGTLAVLMLLFSSHAFAAEQFYWKASYGRGVGTIPPEVCGDKDLDAGLCYTKCKEGYHGIGPVCWENKQTSYGRGVGTIPKIHLAKGKFEERCTDGEENDAGLCYNKCKDGYHGVGPVCWSNAAGSYGRGAGTIPQFVCPAGHDKDAGLCYPTCKAHYKGVGPVCWAEPPAGYVGCGAGVAASKSACAGIVSSQIISVALLAAQSCGVIPGCDELINDAKAAAKSKMAGKDAKSVSNFRNTGKSAKEFFEPLAQKVRPIFEEVEKGTKPVAEAVALLKAEVKAFFTPERVQSAKNLLNLAGNTGFVVYEAMNLVGDDQEFRMARGLASIISAWIAVEGIVNPAFDTPPTQIFASTCDVIAAYLYPTIGQ